MYIKKNIVHIRDSCIGIYGAERVILTIGKNLDKSKYNPILLTINDRQVDEDDFLRAAENIGFQVIVVPVKGKIDLAVLPQIRKIIKNTAPSILHGHDFKSNFYMLLSSAGLDVKRVVTSHGATRESSKEKLYLFLDGNVFYRFFDKIIAVSEQIGSQLRNRYLWSKKIAIIQNGIDVTLIENTQESTAEAPILLPEKANPIFGVIGRLTADKGHRFFLKAFSKISRQYPLATALLVGDGPIRNDLEEMIRELNLTRKIVVCGVRKDMNYIYGMLDCVIIPSLREGLPYTLLEAMVKKVPVIATNVGDIPKLIEHEATGYLTEPTDVIALGKYMKEYLDNPEKSKKMAESAYNLVKSKFSAEIMVKAYERIYDSLSSE